MKYLFCLLLIISTLTAYAGTPTDAQLDRYFSLTGAQENYDSGITSIYMPLMKMMNSNIIKVKDKDRDKADRVASKISSAFTWEHIKPKVYSFYKRNYTSEEIDSCIAFFSRPEYAAIRKKEGRLKKDYDQMMQTVTIQNLLEIAVETELEEAMRKSK